MRIARYPSLPPLARRRPKSTILKGKISDYIEEKREPPELKPFEKYFKRAFRLSTFFMFISVGLIGHFISNLFRRPTQYPAENLAIHVKSENLEGPLKVHVDHLEGNLKGEARGFVVPLWEDGVAGVALQQLEKPQFVYAAPPKFRKGFILTLLSVLFPIAAGLYLSHASRRSNELRALFNRFEDTARNLTGMQNKLKFELSVVLKALHKRFSKYRKNEGLFLDLIANRNANTHFGWFGATVATITPRHVIKATQKAVDELSDPLLAEVTPFQNIIFEKPSAHVFSVVRRTMAGELPYAFFRNARGDICVFTYPHYAALAATKISDGVLDLTQVTMQPLLESFENSQNIHFVPSQFPLRQMVTLRQAQAKLPWPIELLVITSDGTRRGEVLGVFPLNRIYNESPLN